MKNVKNEFSIPLIKKIAEDKKNILNHFRNGGTADELNSKGIYFSFPLKTNKI